jgi:predicted N-acetyltransferase YhbS
LSAEAGWNQTSDDWRLMLEIGEGWGLWNDSGRMVASGMIIPYAPRFAYISMILVTADYRRRGIASDMMRWCMEAVEARNMYAVLDATPAGRTVYQPLGFADIFGLHRLAAEAPRPAPVAGAAVRPMTLADLAAVEAYDAPVFGSDRAPVLRHLRERQPGRAFIAERDGRVSGFVLARDGRSAHHVGPLVAEDGATAIALAARALEGIDGLVYMDAADHQEEFGAWLEDLGFTRQRPFIRMILGRDQPLDDPPRIFAAAGPEMG